MASSSNSRSLKYRTEYLTCGQDVGLSVWTMYSKASSLIILFLTLLYFINLGRVLPTVSCVNCDSFSTPQPFNLDSLRGVLKQLSNIFKLTWADFDNVSAYPHINIMKNPDYSGTREFNISMQGDMDFGDRLTSAIVTS